MLAREPLVPNPGSVRPSFNTLALGISLSDFLLQHIGNARLPPATGMVALSK
jgi:hypothetical protein